MYQESGIYQIRNLLNNHIYIGSAINLGNRKNKHFSELKLKNHYNSHLQRAYDKYGKENFIFEILITCPKNLLEWYEQQFVNQWKPEYNQRKDVTSNFGIKRTDEYKKAVGNFFRGKPLKESHKRNISLGARNIERSNKTSFKGVSLLPSGKYRAIARINGKQKHLGCFTSPEEAYKAYENAILGGGY